MAQSPANERRIRASMERYRAQQDNIMFEMEWSLKCCKGTNDFTLVRDTLASLRDINLCAFRIRKHHFEKMVWDIL